VALSTLMATPVEAGRPLTTEDTETLAPGHVELEISLDYLRASGTDLYLLPVGALNVGILPRLEGAVSAALVVSDAPGASTNAGPSDTIVRLKYRGIDETSSMPALMIAVAARLPTGDAARGLGSEEVDVQMLGVAAKTLGPLTLFLNAGYTIVTQGRRLDVVNLNAAAQIEVARAWSLVGEVVSEFAANGRVADRVVLRAGAAYGFTERVRLDAAVGLGVTRASPDLLLTVGVTLALD
jgi:hypothetical protein